MTKFIKGLELCEGFFFDEAKPILDKFFPNLKYTAGLIGYGSDVLGFDDATSTDHMWGPRFYMFLGKEDIEKKDEIFQKLSENLSYTYKDFSVNFSKPDENDKGVQHPEFITEGNVNPLIFIQTFSDFLFEEIDRNNLDNINSTEWLAFSEHRLLSLTAGKLFVDGLDIASEQEKIKYYPQNVKLYLIASNWDIIASEQAFIKRTGDVGDDIGSRIICARIAERLMRLCFLYKNTYAPYSKWFGTAFTKLDIDENIKKFITNALSSDNLQNRENNIVEAQKLVANLHNLTSLTDKVDFDIETYFGRDIKVIFADKFSEVTMKKLKGTEFENMPLIGSFSQMGELSEFSDNKEYFDRIAKLYIG